MPDPVNQSKTEIRKRMRAVLNSLTDEQKHEASASACSRLLAFESMTNAQVVMLYMPLANEVDVTPIALRSFRSGQTLCVPKVDWQRKEIEPVEVTSLDDHVMDCDDHGVRVPKNCHPILLDSIELVIVPGLAFDPQGNRLGRSAGYYDRFLARLKPSVPKLGIAFDQQIVDNVPTKPHDVAMDIVVTDRRVAYRQRTTSRGV